MINEHIPNFIYEESEEIYHLLEAIKAEINRAYQNVSQEILRWYINTASGDDLDRIAKMIGEIRQGRTDEDFRTAIITRASGIAGTKEILLNIAKEVTDIDAELLEPAAGTVKIRTRSSVTTGKVDILKERIGLAKLAGVKSLFEQFDAISDALQISESISSQINDLDSNVWGTAVWSCSEWGE